MTVKQTQPSVKQQAQMWIMIGRQMASSYPGWTIIISAVVGLIIGLFFAWMIWPLNWTDVKPSSLSNITAENKIYKQVFLDFAATTYATGSMDIKQVASFLGEGWTKDDIIKVLDDMINTPLFANDVARLTAFRDALTNYDGSIGPTPQAPQPISPALLIFFLIILILILVVVSIGLVRRILSRRAEQETADQFAATGGGESGAMVEDRPIVVPPVSRAAGGARSVEKTAWAGESRPPMTQFVTTYAVGDDRYDMSASIETPAGDFLGECGVGISETIGTGSPEKVTALELWLFDKNDVRTLTKVLMSEHAYNDGAVRAKLAPKGDAVMIRTGDIVELITQTLKLNARVVDLVYGAGGAPASSYFQQVTLEIATWNLAG